MAKQQAFIVARFEWADTGTMSIIVGGGSGISNITYTCDVANASENGNILTGLTRDTILTDSEGGTTTIGALLGEWDKDVEDITFLKLNDGAEGYFELGKDDYITLPFSTAEPIEINIGDFVDLALVLDTAQGKQFAKRYEVCEFPKPTFNVNTGGYDYELRLDAYYMKWKNKIFRYIATEVELGEEVGGEASWSLTADLSTHAGVLLRNLTALGYLYNGQPFVFSTLNFDHDLTKARLCTYSETNIIDALTIMADTFECEWWVEDDNIIFGKCEISDLVQVEIGVEAESMSRTDSSGVFATRLYAFGAERNLQSDYRETADEVLISGVVQRRLMLPEDVPYVDAWRYDGEERVYTTAYKLNSAGEKVYVGDTGYSDLEATPHVCGYRVIQTKDEQGKITLTREYVSEEVYDSLTKMTIEETIEGVVSTDDIYPRTNDEVKAVSRYYKMYDPAVEGDTGTLVWDSLIDGGEFDPDTWHGTTDAQYLEVYYRVKSTYFDEKFNEEYVMTGKTLGLVFSSGRLNGMDFEVMFLGAAGDAGATYTSPDGTQWFELVANTNYGAQLPNDTLCPAVGDEFVLYNWQAIDTETGKPTDAALQMITNAEQELLAYAIEYLWDTMVDDGVYETELNPNYVYAEGDSNIYIQRTFAVGQRILLVNAALFDIPRESRVLGYRVSLDIPYDHPTYKIGESVQYSRIGNVESKMNELTYNGNSFSNIATNGSANFYLIKTNDTVAASDANAYSALRSLMMFLRRDVDDEAAGNIIFDKNIDVKRVATIIGQVIACAGVQFGEVYEKGLLGVGGLIDADGVGELDALTLRKWLEVPELRYNRVTVMTGVTWQTVGGGIIESVEVDTDTDGNELQSGIIALKLEDGELGMVAVDDLCMGIFHDFDNQYINDDYNEDQHNGNFHFAGFGTSYFYIDQILDESNNSRFHYVLRDPDENWGQQHHPREFMNFACYANPNNTDRQRCKYSTTDYEIRLENMTDWTYGAGNYYYIEGKLDGFSIDGTPLVGNGIYIGNGYFSGIIQQIENAPYTLNIEYTENDTLLEEGESAKITCTISKAWEDLTGKVKTWQVKRETGDTEADEKWNEAHTDFDGTIEVTYDDLFTDGVTSALLRFTATMEDGTEVSNSTILHSYVSGEDGLSIIPTASNIVLSEGQLLDDWSLEVRAYRGGEQIALARDMVAVTNTITDVSVAYTSTNGVIQFNISRTSAEAKVDGSFSYTITIDGVAYPFTCGVSSVFDGEKGDKGDKGDTGAQGEKGDKGDDGEPAIYYELVMSCETLDYNAFAGAFAPSSIVLSVMRVEGDERTNVPFTLSLQFYAEDGTLNGNLREYNIDEYEFIPKITGGWSQIVTSDMPANSYFEFILQPTENSAVTLTHTIYPTTSYMPRVRYWEEVAEGGQFCQGKLGEQYRDIVIHTKDTNNYFCCQSSHTKSSASEPQAGTETEYWKPMSYFEMVATNLLLADTAKVNNLYVDDVFMVGYDSAIWLNPSHEGMKIVKATELKKTDRTSQFEEEAWNNPTAYFHANEIPDPSTYYGGTALNGSATVSATTYINSGNADANISETLCTSGTLLTLPAGRRVAITISNLAVTFTEGTDVDGEALHLDGSLVNFIVRVNIGSRSYDVWGQTLEFDAEGSGSLSPTYANFTIYRTNTQSTSQAVTVSFYIWGQFKHNASFQLGTNGSISINAVADPTEGYVSQYGANGLLIGQNSSTYFRAKVDKDDPQYQILAGGYGIDIDTSGSLQQVAGNLMPLGGLLLTAYFYWNTSNNNMQVSAWTFDEQTIRVEFASAGQYYIHLPQAWGDKFGSINSAHASIQMTLATHDTLIGRAYLNNSSGYWGMIDVRTYSTSSAFTNTSFFLQFTYISHTTTITLSSGGSGNISFNSIEQTNSIDETKE